MLVLLILGSGAIGVFVFTSAKAPRPRSAPTPQLSPIPHGYRRRTDDIGRFQLAVPRSWEILDPSSPGAQEYRSTMAVLGDGISLEQNGLTTPLGELDASASRWFIARGPVDPSTGVRSFVVLQSVFAPLLGQNALSAVSADAPFPDQLAKARSATVSFGGTRALEYQAFVPVRGSASRAVAIRDVMAGHGRVYVLLRGGVPATVDTIGTTVHIN